MRIQGFKKGGGIHGVVFSAAIVFQGGLGTWKIFKFRLYESASEAVGDHNKHAKFMVAGQ